MDNTQLLFTVADRSYFALLKKEIHALAVEMGFSQEKAGKVDIVVAELVSNLVKHANGGHLLAKRIKHTRLGEGIELVSMDNGVGIPDLKRMMQDGVNNTSGFGKEGKVPLVAIFTHQAGSTYCFDQMLCH